jgi:hypothetical protein
VREGKTNGSLRAMAIAVAAASVLGGLAAAYPSSDPDAWFHLSLGRQMAETGGIPATESACAVSEGRPFANHEWLYDLGLWEAWDLAGPAGTTALRIVLAGLLTGLSAAFALRLGASPGLAVVAVLLALPVVRPYLDLRPHVAGYALALVFVHLLWARGRPGIGRILALGLVAAVWVNVHGSFPMAPILAGMRVLRPGTGETTRDRAAWGVAALVTAAATLANPWGPLLYATVAHHGMPVHRMATEWASWDFGASIPRDACFLILTAGALAGFLVRERRGRVDELALLVVFLIPVLGSEKFVPGLLVGATPILAAHLSRWRVVRSPVAIVAASAVLGAAVAVVPPGTSVAGGFSYVEQPREALAFARDAGLRGRVFHPFIAGGYVGFAGLPELQPFIDGRLYIHDADGVATYTKALQDYDGFRSLQSRFGFVAVIVDRQDAGFGILGDGLSRDPAFRLAWLDDRFAMWLPSGLRLDLPGFRILRAGTDPRYLFDLPDDELARAREEVARVQASGRGEETGWLAGGLLGLRRAGLSWAPADALRPPTNRAGCVDAATDLGLLASRRPDVPMFGYFHAVALACAGRCDDAKAAADEARAFPDARMLAGSLAGGACSPESPDRH